MEIIGLGEFMVGRCIGKQGRKGKKWVREGKSNGPQKEAAGAQCTKEGGNETRTA